jgi:phospholipid/cholesterol/gamma-HCH transport system substrate-binding protein
VTVGKVGQLHLIKKGVRVDLQLNDCGSPKIPASTGAVIANRSVVGEQYVDLVPPNGKGPSIRAGAMIPMSRNKVPIATQTLLVNLDRLVKSVNLDNLRTTVTELGNAVQGRGGDLGRLLDATNALLATANEPRNLDATIKLIDDSSTVLQTQLDSRDPLRSWTHSLNLLSAQLKKSDPDIRRLLTTGPSDLATVRDFISNNRTDFGATLANLSTVGNLIVRHLGGLNQVLELYPALAAGGPTALHDNEGALGLILQTTPDPQDCGDPLKDQEGYNGTARRSPNDLSPQAPNVSVRCTASASGANAKNVRGSANIPGGDPISNSGGGRAYPRVVTKNTVAVGPSLGKSTALGDGSWLALLTDALH